MKEINLWIFNHYAVSPGYSSGTRHFDLAKELVNKGLQVTIFASSFDHLTREEKHFQTSKDKVKEELYQGVKFVWLKTISYRGNDWRRILNMLNYSFLAYLEAIRKTEKPDVVVGSLMHPFAAVVGYLVAKKKKCSFYFEERDLWPQTLIDLGKVSSHNPIVWFLDKLESFLYRRARRIIVLFDKARDYVKQKGIDPEKVVYLPNGVDLKRYHHFEQDLPHEYDEFFRDHPDAFFALYLGAHGLANSLDDILDTACLLKNTNKKIHFLLVGDGPDKIRLVKRKKDEKIDNLTFLPSLPKEKVPALLGRAKVGLIAIKDAPLYKWGISMNKIFDYMAARLPILALCNIERTFIEESGGGVKVRTPSEAAAALEELFNNQTLLLERGEMSRNFVEKSHSWEILSQKFLEVLEKDCKS